MIKADIIITSLPVVASSSFSFSISFSFSFSSKTFGGELEMSSFALLHGLEGDGGTLELDDGVPDDEALLGQLVLVVVDRGEPPLLLLLLLLLAVFADVSADECEDKGEMVKIIHLSSLLSLDVPQWLRTMQKGLDLLQGLCSRIPDFIVCTRREQAARRHHRPPPHHQSIHQAIHQSTSRSLSLPAPPPLSPLLPLFSSLALPPCLRTKQVQ